MGFNVLAFAFGFYGEWNANRQLNEGIDPKIACRYSWSSNSKETWPIFEYVTSTKKSPKPMHIAGFDGEKVRGASPILGVL